MTRYAMDDYTSYLLYAPEKDTRTSTKFGLPTVTSIMETTKSEITAIPTIMFGVENNYAIDLGTSKMYQVNFARVNPKEVHDEYELYDTSSENYRADAYRYWSNGHYIEMLMGLSDVWQNSNHYAYPQTIGDEDVRLHTGGYFLHMEFEGPLNGGGGLSSNRMRPEINANVFFYGGITVTFDTGDVQMVRFGIVFSVSTMKSISYSPADTYTIEYYYNDSLLTVQTFPVNTVPVLLGNLECPDMPNAYVHHFMESDGGGTHYFRPGMLAPSLRRGVSCAICLDVVFYIPLSVYIFGREGVFGLVGEYTSSSRAMSTIVDPSISAYAAYLEDITDDQSYDISRLRRLVNIPYSDGGGTVVEMEDVPGGASYDVVVTMVGAGGAGRSAPEPGEKQNFWSVLPNSGGQYHELYSGGSGGSGEAVTYSFTWDAPSSPSVTVRLGRGGYKSGNDSPSGTSTTVELSGESVLEASGGVGGTDVQGTMYYSTNIQDGSMYMTTPGIGGGMYARGANGRMYSEGATGNSGQNAGQYRYCTVVQLTPQFTGFNRESVPYGCGSDIGCPGGGSAPFRVVLSKNKWDTIITTRSQSPPGSTYPGAVTYPSDIRSRGGNGMSTRVEDAPLSTMSEQVDFSADDGLFGGGGGGAWKGRPGGAYIHNYYQGNGGHGGEGAAIVTVFEQKYKGIIYDN